MLKYNCECGQPDHQGLLESEIHLLTVNSPRGQQQIVIKIGSRECYDHAMHKVDAQHVASSLADKHFENDDPEASLDLDESEETS